MDGFVRAAASGAYRLKQKLTNGASAARRRGAERSLQHLNRFEDRIYSQNGEDGILREIFSRISHARTFVEIGCESGDECNTALLSRRYGWHGLMIEGDRSQEVRLRGTFEPLGVGVEIAYVDRDNVVEIFECHNVSRDLDLLSIDIDGNDLFVWQALHAYRASCVVIEYNPFFGPTRPVSVAYDPRRRYRADRHFGASLAALEKVGRSLGYVLVGTERRGVNAFFVREDLVERVGFPAVCALRAYRARPLSARLLPAGSGELVAI